MIDKTFLILQGYSTSKEQMEEIYDKYKNLGFSNIIISTYSSSVPSKLLNKPFVLINDTILGKYDRNDKFYRNSTGLNYQILTTKNAIKYINKNHPNTEYIFKLRADQFFDKADKFVKSWIKELKTISTNINSPFDKKIITMGWIQKYATQIMKGNDQISQVMDWYIADYFNFGTLKDMTKLWDIPVTYNDYIRAEDYISNFYLYKYFSKEPEEKISYNIRNSEIYKYANDPLNYFMFDWRTHKNILYSFKLKKFLNEYSDVCNPNHLNPKHKYPFANIDPIQTVGLLNHD
tara:strand:- start:7760 stop:8632 length:873 start_codon:yes stop_codon:yes gene_type:complete